MGKCKDQGLLLSEALQKVGTLGQAAEEILKAKGGDGRGYYTRGHLIYWAPPSPESARKGDMK